MIFIYLVNDHENMILFCQSTDVTCNVEMQSTETLATANPELRQDLKMQADVNPLDAEQTWPTEEELKEAEEG